MDRLSIQNLEKITSLRNEVEYEKASSLFLKLRVLEKEDGSYRPKRNRLRSLIKEYERQNWSSKDELSDTQITESDLAESLVQAENAFLNRRKELIRKKLKDVGLNQGDLGKILGHRKGYMSELMNGLKPFSKEDLVIINRLFKIKLEDLIPTFIQQDRAFQIQNTLKSLKSNQLKLTATDFDLIGL